MRAAFFNVISRTLIILLAAGLISGGLYLLVSAGFGQRAGAGAFGDNGGAGRPLISGVGIDRSVQNPAAASGLTFGSPSRFGRGPGDGIFWWAGISGILRNLGLIALITIAVAILSKVLHWATRRRPAHPAHPAPD